MSRLATRILASLAVLAAAPAARAYTRETTTVHHPESGVPLFWRSRQVTFHVNAASASPTPCQSAAAAEAAAAAGIATWAGATRSGETAACTDFSFVHGAATTVTTLGKDGTNLIVFRKGLCSDVAGLDPCQSTPGACASKFNCWEHGLGTIALTTNSFDSQTGEITDSDIELFTWDGNTPPTGYYFTCQDPSAPSCDTGTFGQLGCNAVDVQAVVTHESGHALGLDHVCTSEFAAPFGACPSGSTPIMAPTVGKASQRALAQDDVAGACFVYPTGGPTPGTGSSSSSGGGGCATGSGAGLGALLAGTAALRRLRRRRG